MSDQPVRDPEDSGAFHDPIRLAPFRDVPEPDRLVDAAGGERRRHRTELRRSMTSMGPPQRGHVHEVGAADAT